MSNKTITTTIYITDKQNKGLKALSKRTRISKSDYIREAIDMVLKKYETKSNKWIVNHIPG